MSVLTTNDPLTNSYASSSSAKCNPPSLSTLCTEIISSKIEKYPQEAFAVLSPDEWDRIIQHRYRVSAPNRKEKHTTATSGVALDGSGRMIPAINVQTLRLIEKCNAHLATSDVSDTLVWKDCVEYAFRSNSEYVRPKALRVPWPHLIKSLQNAGQEILQCWNRCSENEITDLATTKLRFNRALTTLCDSPMSVELLTATGIGKIVSKIIKSMLKSKQLMGEGNTAQRQGIGWFLVESTEKNSSSQVASPCPLTQLQCLLASWKEVASTSGVKMTTLNESVPHSLSTACGAPALAELSGKRFCDEQRRKDMETLVNCNSWRELYSILELRRETLKTEMGANLRKSRENISSDRLKTKACRLLKGMKGELKGGRADVEKPPGPAKSKIAVLKKEAKAAVVWQRAEKGASSFGCSIANYGQSLNKRKPEMKRASSVEDNGKKMRLPSCDSKSGLSNSNRQGLNSAGVHTRR